MSRTKDSSRARNTMNPHRFRRETIATAAAFLIAVLLCPLPAAAQEEWGANFMRTSYVEGQVTIQRATEIENEEAVLNIPIIPGDRLWTGEDGLVELQLADGMIMRLDRLTKLDAESLGIPGDPDLDNTLLRLWSGSAILEGGDFDFSSKTFQVDTPAASIYVLQESHFRLDIDADGATVLSVYNGLVEAVAMNSSVLVRPGQRTVIRSGYPPEEPFAFNTTELDDFGYWSQERSKEYSYNLSESYVDESIAPYTYNLTDYGNWVYVSVYGGYVWRPYVSYAWYPYHYGYWWWSPWGYYWYSWEPWSWCCYHYGRWCWVGNYGWCWYPGTRWSGGWVGWGGGDDYVGWVPLTPDNRHASFGVDMGGQALGMSSVHLPVKSADASLNSVDASAWTFIKSDGLASRDISASLIPAEEIASRGSMKLYNSAPMVSYKNRKSPGAELKKIYESPGYEGHPMGAAEGHGKLTASGRRYAVTGSQSGTPGAAPRTTASPAYNTDASYNTGATYGSAGTPPSWVDGTAVPRPSYGQPATPRGYGEPVNRGDSPTGKTPTYGQPSNRSYSRSIYSGINRSNPPSASSGRSSIPARTRPSSGSQPPSSGSTVGRSGSSMPSSTRRVAPPRTSSPPRSSGGRSISGSGRSGSSGRSGGGKSISGGGRSGGRSVGSGGRSSGGGRSGGSKSSGGKSSGKKKG